MTEDVDEAPPGPTDRCPYCLGFPEMARARAEGVRFCPNCGSDWETVDAPIRETSAPPDPFAIEADGRPVFDVPVRGFDPRPAPTPPPRVITHHTPAMGLPAVEAADSELPPRAQYGPVTVGLVLGLLGTIAAASLYERFFPPPSPEPPRARVVLVAPDAGPDEAPEDAEPPPPAPAPDAARPPPVDPVERAERQARAVEEAIALAFKGSPPGVLVKVTARVTDGIAYLTGEVDSQARREAVATAAGQVFGVKAVDTRALKVVFRQHVVESGDTLGRLAGYYYGNPGLWRRLLEANPQLGGKVDLKLGETLNIPME